MAASYVDIQPGRCHSVNMDAAVDEFLDPEPRKGFLRLHQQGFRMPLFLLASMFFMTFMLNFTTVRMPDPKTQHQLPDIALDNLPRILWFEKLTNVVVTTMNILNPIVVFGLYPQHMFALQKYRCIAAGKPIPDHVEWPDTTFGKTWRLIEKFLRLFMDSRAKAYNPRGITPVEFETTVPQHVVGEITTALNIHVQAWLRYWATFAFVTMGRGFVNVFTVLPTANNHCKDPGPQPIPNIWYNAFIGVLTLGGSNIHCGDMLWSGHTATIMVAFMSIWTYSPLVHWAFRPFICVATTFSFFCMWISRSHYVDDVYVAIWVCVFVYIAIRHDTRFGVPQWIQMFIMLPSCPSFGSEEADGDEKKPEDDKKPAAVDTNSNTMGKGVASALSSAGHHHGHRTVDYDDATTGSAAKVEVREPEHSA